MSESCLVTIVTPTYNRSALLPRLYKSLCDQTNRCFIWFVVDDGSTDNTEEYIHSILNISPFRILYHKKDNGGKHTALNYAFERTETPLLFIVDSDDVLTKDAVSIICNDYCRIVGNNYCGLVYRRGDFNGNFIGNANGITGYCNYNDIRFKYKVNGDLAEVWKTECIKKYSFPVFEGERFIGEGFLWSQMSEKYDVYMNNIVIYYCEYLPGGLSNAGRRMRIRTPYGGLTHANQYVKPGFPILVRLKNGVLYNCYLCFIKKKEKNNIEKSNSRIITSLTKPLGFVLYKYLNR